MVKGQTQTDASSRHAATPRLATFLQTHLLLDSLRVWAQPCTPGIPPANSWNSFSFSCWGSLKVKRDTNLPSIKLKLTLRLTFYGSCARSLTRKHIARPKANFKQSSRHHLLNFSKLYWHCRKNRVWILTTPPNRKKKCFNIKGLFTDNHMDPWITT